MGFLDIVDVVATAAKDIVDHAAEIAKLTITTIEHVERSRTTSQED